jgi:hypothetical protein
MVLKGEAGAVQFVVYTDWYPPHVQEERMVDHRQSVVASMGPCEYLDGRECYYDGSGLRADEWVRDLLIKRGSDAIWEALTEEYKRLFG